MRRFSTEKKKQLNQQGKSIDVAKVELGKVKKCATEMRFFKLKKSPNTCADILGIKPSAECTCEKIVTSIGTVIGVLTVTGRNFYRSSNSHLVISRMRPQR